MSENFGTVVVVDFEYEIDDNLLPNVLCMVAYVLDENLRHMRTICLWRGEFGSTPPFDIGSDALIVAYSAWAEMTCFQVLGWQFPVHIFDLHTAYLAASNILLPHDPDEERRLQKPRNRLSDACRAYGIEGWERKTSPRQSAPERGAADIARRKSLITARKTCGCRSDSYAECCSVTSDFLPLTFRVCCIGRITAPRQSHSFKHAGFRGTRSCGIWCRRTRNP